MIAERSALTQPVATLEPNVLLLLLIVGLPLLGSPLVALAGRRLGPRVSWFALVFPVVSFVSLLVLATRMELPGSALVTVPWVPSLGLNLSFLVDGLSLLFALVVSGMGILVFFYAGHYLDDHYEHHGRFYGYLTLFMAAMLGTLLSDHVVLLFMFWELTGIASFLLIGFLHEEEGSRVGARQALLVTGATGLMLFVGVLLLQQAADTSSLRELLSAPLPWAEHGPRLTAALVLIALGAFGKSAQFPLHFWLPNAMAAPTPVSAYLHSATMVKLGVFLCARVFPLFILHEWWAPLLGTVGFTTMLFAACMALVSHDLKAILAYSTVSQLGFLIGHYGLGAASGLEHDYLHILSHVLFKGCLFMVVGVVAHATGLRDIRQLGGLFRLAPLLGVTALVATASMAGLPGTLGFISKEMMLAESFANITRHGGLGMYAAACAVLASVLKVAFSARLFTNLFLGPVPEKVAHHFHAPSVWLQLPPALLAGGALVLGLFPALLHAPLHAIMVEGLNRPAQDLAIWHGFSKELLVSTVVILLGAGLYQIGQKVAWRWQAARWLRFDAGFEAGVEIFSKFTKTLTRWLRSDQPMDHLPVIIGFLLCVVGGGMIWKREELFGGIEADWSTVRPVRVLAAFLIALAVVAVILLRRWTSQLIALSVSGFLTCFYFVLYRAPDLALTQILVETVTLILVLLLLARFPRSAQEGEESGRPTGSRLLCQIVLSLGVGAMVTGLVLATTARPHPEPIGPGFLAHTVELAKGSNAVNTILVDFRGFDTLGEVTVLVIATLGCLGLLMRYKRTPEQHRRGLMGPPGLTGAEPGKESE